MTTYDKLMAFKSQIENVSIKTYLDAIFSNPMIQSELKGRDLLIDYIYRVMTYTDEYSDDILVKDILIAGVFTRYLGKIYAYKSYNKGLTRSGSLLGYHALSYSLSIQSFIHAESFLGRAIPETMKDDINHCILVGSNSYIDVCSLEAKLILTAELSIDAVI